MSVLCAVGSRPFLVLPVWLCPFVPAALAAFPRDALQRGAAFLEHEVDVFVVFLFSTDVAVSVVVTASVEYATPKGFWEKTAASDVDLASAYFFNTSASLVARQQIRTHASVFGTLEDFHIFLRVIGIGS